jgi:hypothetical protein
MPEITVACPRPLVARYKSSKRFYNSETTMPVVGWSSQGEALVVNRRGRLVVATRARPRDIAGVVLSFVEVVPEECVS